MTLPDLNGDWPLTPLKWQVLRAAVSARVSSPGLGVTVTRDTGDLPTAQLSPRHEVVAFDCGVEKLNDRLRRAAEDVGAGREVSASGNRTRVCLAGDAVAAYISYRVARVNCPEQPQDGSLEFLYGPSLAVDLRWRGAALAQALVGSLVNDVRDDPHQRLVGVLGVAISPEVLDLFRCFGARPIGDVIHPRGVVITRADADASGSTAPAME